jgi:hypothetical protein
MHTNIPVIVFNKFNAEYNGLHFDDFCYDVEVGERRDQDCEYEARSIALNYGGSSDGANFTITSEEFWENFDEEAFNRVGDWESGVTDPYFQPVILDGVCYNNWDVMLHEVFYQTHIADITAQVVAVYDAKLN